MTQLVIPIAENTSYFPPSEYFFPKPLVEVCGKPMIVQVVNNHQKQIKLASFIFVIPSELEKEYSLGKILTINCNEDVRIIQRNSPTSGGLCSALMAIDHLKEDEPIVIMNMDEILNVDLQEIINNFTSSKVSAGLVTFNSTHPRWCFAITNEDGSVQRCVEKKVISDKAMAGFYYFKDKSTFINNAFCALSDDDHLEGNFYISSAINQIILRGEEVGSVHINETDYFSLFSPEMIREYEKFKAKEPKNNAQEISSKKINLLIPAAGNGSRFSKDGWTVPKPMIDINGSLMIEEVINNLNLNNCNRILLLRDEHLSDYSDHSQRLSCGGNKIIRVKDLTEGTICTALLARRLIDCDDPLLIANSDQIVEFDCNDFVKDCQRRSLDGSILVFKDKDRDIKWSFAEINNQGEVIRVAEKEAISDLATVGIYYFNKGSEFISAAIDMIANNERVNGEFYTCPVYNYMIKNGAKIGIYEIPPSSMNGIGTPIDLRTYLEKFNISTSKNDPEYIQE